MKHNPKLHERVAALPGHARLHPLQDAGKAQGALELMWRLQARAGEVAGLPHVSLQPSAGSHEELAGLLLTRAYHEDRGEQRTKVLTPDTAHGTNPATVTMAGYEVVKVGGAGRRRRPRRPAREGGRGRRLPHAHEPEHARALRHQHRGDRPHRARRRGDALLRRGQPQRRDGDRASGRHGLRHRPLQPAQDVHAAARRRRPGAGPIACSDRIEPFLPVPQVVRGAGDNGHEPSFDSTSTGPSRSASCAASRATSASSCAPTRTSARSAATA